MSWDDLQREVLEALGHRLYRVDVAAGLPPGRLVDALLQAAGAGPQAVALLRARLATGLPLTPAAKRALWPELRALRRRTGSG